MPLPDFPTPPPAPQRGIDNEETYRPKADAWAYWLGYELESALELFGAELVAEATSFFTSTSATSRTLGVGSKALTIDAGKAFKTGQSIRATATADATQWLFGTVTTYDADTGALVIDVATFGGAGTVASWNVSISGPQGIAGYTILSGADAPAADLGRDGDFYFRPSTFAFYGPKAGGAWGAPLIIRGNTVLHGDGLPAAGLGQDGDYYINDVGLVMFGPKTAGAWPAGRQLVGPPGSITETIYLINDGAPAPAVWEVDPANGGYQFVLLGVNATPKGTNFANGQMITLEIDDGTARSVNWTDASWGGIGVIWKTDGGSAPQLATTDVTTIVLWKRGGQVRGARVGNA